MTIPSIVLLFGYLLAFAGILGIVLHRREPTATLAWVLGVLFVPYLGLIAYALLGRRRLKRHVRRRLARANIIEPHLARLTEEGVGVLTPGAAPSNLPRPGDREMVQLTDRIGMRLPTCGNRVQVFVNTNSAYLSMERAIMRAKHHVHLEYYIYEPDDTGRRFRDLLVRKANEGVKVRVLTDGVGSFGLEDFMGPLIDAGGDFAQFSPVSLFTPHWNRANFRNHRKITLVDGKVAFTGGANIGDEYTGRKKKIGPWRDTHLRVEGPAVHHLQEVFAEDWHDATQRESFSDDWFPEQEAKGDAMVQIVASGPDTGMEPLQRIFFTAITSAKKRIYLTTPYFVPDQSILVALQTAALRGVDVRLLLPHRSDMPLVLQAGRSYYDELLEQGVRIYEYMDGVLHAKTMVVDDSWATVGSANMDIRSFRLNFEINAAVYGPSFADELGKVFSNDLKHSKEITRAQRATRTTQRRVVEGLARTLSPLL